MAALEEELRQTHSNRLENEALHKGLVEALNETGVGNSIDIHNTINLLQVSLKRVEVSIQQEQAQLKEKTVSNAVEQLREQCRKLTRDLFAIDDNIQALKLSSDNSRNCPALFPFRKPAWPIWRKRVSKPSWPSAKRRMR